MIRIGTRTSKLAMVQTENIKARILQAFPEEEVEIVPIVTKGDRELDKHLGSFGGKGVFAKEIEEQLLDGSIDIAVHSAKDVPMEFPEGLCLGAVVEREDARDVLLTRVAMERNRTGVRHKSKLDSAVTKTSGSEKPNGSSYIVGTSSLRRELQISRIIEGVNIRLLRGNVPTRLQKLKDGQYDAILLAAAGLKRLGLDNEPDVHYEYLDTEEFVPAAGQGILAVETRKGALPEVMAVLNDEHSYMALMAERAFLTRIGGSCNAPCGVYCRLLKQNISSAEEMHWKITGMYARDGHTPSYSSCIAAAADVAQLATAAEGLADALRCRTVSLVGAGPGNRGLISEKALACVREAEVIIYDNLISPSILNEAAHDAQLLYAGKRANAHSMKQEDINNLIIAKAKEGKYVVRLKGGDPFIFGRGGEEALALRGANIPFEVVPGVSSAYSVPAFAGIPVTHRGVAASFHVITGHEGDGKGKSGVDFGILAKEQGTLVFLMGLHALGDIARRLIEGGKSADTPVAVIQSGATARQRMVKGTLADIEGRVKSQGLGTPAMIVIGDVVALQEQLGWQRHLPLSGKRILLTGSRSVIEQIEQELEPLGAETVSISLVDTYRRTDERIEGCLRGIGEYTWIVFTSGAGVRYFFDALKDAEDAEGRKGIDRRCLGNVRFATVGTSTADVLSQYGYRCDFLPSEYQSKVLAQEWVPTLTSKDKVLLVKAVQGSELLSERLRDASISADVACLYETRVDMRRADEVARHVNEVDYTVLASGSAAKALGLMAEAAETGSRVVAIGPVTADACEKAGIQVSLVAEEYTARGIAKAIMEDAESETNKK